MPLSPLDKVRKLERDALRAGCGKFANDDLLKLQRTFNGAATAGDLTDELIEKYREELTNELSRCRKIYDLERRDVADSADELGDVEAPSPMLDVEASAGSSATDIAEPADEPVSDQPID